MDEKHLLSPVGSSGFLKTMFQNSESTSILVLDLEGTILYVNNSFQKSFGYHRDFLAGRNYSMFFVEEDRMKLLPEKKLRETTETGSSRNEHYFLKSNGEPTPVSGESIFIDDEIGKPFIMKIIYGTHELMKKNEEQERTIRDRDIFIHAVSHDLKSPVSNIDGLVNSLKEGYPGPDEFDQTIRFLGQSVDRLKNKIDELAALGRELENTKTNSTGVKFSEALDDVLFDLREEIEKSGAEIISDFSRAPVIHFSGKNLKSILQNLVSNSVKFRSLDRKAKIVVDTGKGEDGYVFIKISDNGIGIGEDDKEKIFRIYHRLNTGIKGTGVGLTIVKRLVENSGGKIELESRVGEGSTFTLLLPDGLG